MNIHRDCKQKVLPTLCGLRPRKGKTEEGGKKKARKVLALVVSFIEFDIEEVKCCRLHMYGNMRTLSPLNKLPTRLTRFRSKQCSRIFFELAMSIQIDVTLQIVRFFL